MNRLALALLTATVCAATAGTAVANDALRADGTLKYRFYTDWELLYLERDGPPNTDVGFFDPTAPPAIGNDLVKVLSTDDALEDGYEFAGRAVLGYRLDPESAVEIVFTGFEDDGSASESDPGANLQALIGGGAGSIAQANNANFEDATRFTLDYDSDYYSGELNYRHALEVPGADYRFSLMAGLRGVRFTEDLRFTSVSPGSGVGTHDVATRNTLFGAQLGFDGFIPLYEDRIELELAGVAGGYANQSSTTAEFNNQVPAFRYRESRTEWGPAALLEASGFLKFRIYRGVRLSAGYRAIYLVNVATAPDQFPESASNSDFFGNRFDNDGRTLFHGPSLKVSVDF
ncbi:MAG: hypothetical protein HKP30_03375 [Myxococcales bacterium]|nr:hypothetical protein [Myxococcales bacterium]